MFGSCLGVWKLSGSLEVVWEFGSCLGVWKLSGSLEVNLEMSVVQTEVSVEVKNRARVLDNIIISRSPETGVQGLGVQDEVK